MTDEPEQLVLDLPHRPALGAEDFLVSQSNGAAVALVDRWPEWPHWAISVSGPPRSGKSHLVNVWRARSSADLLSAADLGEDAIARFASASALAVEDIDRGIGDERVLFHLLNLAREQKVSILLTSRQAPGEIDITLPDLRSRLRALPHVAIDRPDEVLLKALLIKLFSDRQLLIEPHVVSHIARHIERNTEVAAHVVAEIDRLALATRRRVTRALAAEAISRVCLDDPAA